MGFFLPSCHHKFSPELEVWKWWNILASCECLGLSWRSLQNLTIKTSFIHISSNSFLPFQREVALWYHSATIGSEKTLFFFVLMTNVILKILTTFITTLHTNLQIQNSGICLTLQITIIDLLSVGLYGSIMSSTYIYSSDYSWSVKEHWNCNTSQMEGHLSRPFRVGFYRMVKSAIAIAM